MERYFYPECPVKKIVSITSLYTFSFRRFPAGYFFKGESHDFYEAVIVTDGKAGITAGKNVHVLSAGQMIVHTPNEFHKIWSDCGTEPETIIFSFRANAFPKLDGQVFSLNPESVAELKYLYHEAERTFLLQNKLVVTPREGQEAEADMLVKKLELFLLSSLVSKRDEHTRFESKSAENYYRIVSVMEKEIGSSLTGNDLSRLCHMSIPALEKTVRRYAGRGVMAHYNSLKMKKASEMLLNGHSVKETAYALGFSNQNYFSACFKKWSGKSPTEWKSEK